MRDGVVALGKDHVIFVAECVGKAANKIEQANTAGRNVGAVLNVSLRPELFRRDIVALVEQRVEGFQHECFDVLG